MASAISMMNILSVDRGLNQHPILTNIKDYSGTTYPGQRCDCCPYNYHIDLDFLHFLENVNSTAGVHRDSKKIKQPSSFRTHSSTNVSVAKNLSRENSTERENGNEIFTTNSGIGARPSSSGSATRQQTSNHFIANSSRFSFTEPEISRCQQPVNVELAPTPAASVATGSPTIRAMGVKSDQRYRSETDLFVNATSNKSLERRTASSIKQLHHTSRDLFERLERRFEIMTDNLIYSGNRKKPVPSKINRRPTDVTNESIMMSLNERTNKKTNIIETSDGTRIMQKSPNISMNKPNIYVSVTTYKQPQTYQVTQSKYQAPRKEFVDSVTPDMLQAILDQMSIRSQRMSELEEEVKSLALLQSEISNLRAENRRLHLLLSGRGTTNHNDAESANQHFLSHYAAETMCEKSTQTVISSENILLIDHNTYGMPRQKLDNADNWKWELNREEFKSVGMDADRSPSVSYVSTTRLKPASRVKSSFLKWDPLVKKASTEQIEFGIDSLTADTISASAIKDNDLKDSDATELKNYSLTPRSKEFKQLDTFEGKAHANKTEDIALEAFVHDMIQDIIRSACKQINIEEDSYTIFNSAELHQNSPVNLKTDGNYLNEEKRCQDNSIETQNKCLMEENSNRLDQQKVDKNLNLMQSSNTTEYSPPEDEDLADLRRAQPEILDDKDGVKTAEIAQSHLMDITGKSIIYSDSVGNAQSENMPQSNSAVKLLLSKGAEGDKVCVANEDTCMECIGNVAAEESPVINKQNIKFVKSDADELQDCSSLVAVREHVDKDKSVQIEVIFDVQDVDPARPASESDTTADSANDSEDTVIENELDLHDLNSDKQQRETNKAVSSEVLAKTVVTSSERNGVMQSRSSALEKDMDVTLQELQTCSHREGVQRQLSSLSGGAGDGAGSTSDETDFGKEVTLTSEQMPIPLKVQGLDGEHIQTNKSASASTDHRKDMGSERHEGIKTLHERSNTGSVDLNITDTSVDISAELLRNLMEMSDDTKGDYVFTTNEASTGSISDETPSESINDELVDGSIIDEVEFGSMADESVNSSISGELEKDGSVADEAGEGSVTGQLGNGFIAGEMEDGSIADGSVSSFIAEEVKEGSIAGSLGEAFSADELANNSIAGELADGSIVSESINGSIVGEVEDVFVDGLAESGSIACEADNSSVTEENDAKSGELDVISAGSNREEEECDSESERMDVLDSLISEKVYAEGGELLTACSVYCQWINNAATVSSADYRLARGVLERHWFYAAGRKNSSAQQVQHFLSTWSQFGDSFLSAVVNMQDMDGNTALHYAVSQGNFEIVAALLDTGMCDPNIENQAGYSPLLLVALLEIESEEQKQLVQKIFSAGDVNAKSSSSGQTALMLTASQGGLDTLRLLMECEAEVNIQDEDGSTALMCASEHGHTEIIKILLDVPGCDSTLTDMDGSTAYTIAMEEGHHDIGALLLAHMSTFPSQVKSDDDD